MSRLTKIELTPQQHAALEAAYKQGQTHSFRQRCQMILLKAKKQPSWQIAEQVGCCMISVNHWVKRYQKEGIEGLKTKPGRGRKAILCSPQDLPAVRAAVAANCQRLSLAQAQLQEQLGKEFSPMTLKRFLKNPSCYLDSGHGRLFGRVRLLTPISSRSACRARKDYHDLLLL